MKTFSITTLGCKVNHYESDQLAALLRSRGMIESTEGPADLRIVNTCSVTTQAASKSRYESRKAVRLPVLNSSNQTNDQFTEPTNSFIGGKTIVTGCWATSDKASAEKLPGVDAVLTHHDDVHSRLTELLNQWQSLENTSLVQVHSSARPGTNSLPILGEHQAHRQRAFLKIQDGCDAHCTYCIIPQLRPNLWSKSVEDCVQEAKNLVASGHVELVLTGIFLGAFGQSTALRRRQPAEAIRPIAKLINALCTQVPGLRRLRLSSLEPGDLTADLIHQMKQHPQLVPHFHLPLQSGSDRVLHRMNRQYTRGDYLEMIDRVHESFDRPAITTDIIVGFPGETDDEFNETVEIARKANFVHIHAFPFSPRPKTAAARWTKQFVQSSIASERIAALQELSTELSFNFRQPFIGQTVELLVEKPNSTDEGSSQRHGRCERYFDVHFESSDVRDGDLVRVRVDRVTPARTHGTLLEVVR